MALEALFWRLAGTIVGTPRWRSTHAGELASPRQAALPIAAAIGGMVVPASIYFLTNGGGITSRGWAIPMATDIAFALGVTRPRLIRCGLDWRADGLGGGVVIVPLLVIAFGVDIRYAIGASLVSVIATSSGAAAAYVREGYSNIKLGMFLEILYNGLSGKL